MIDYTTLAHEIASMITEKCATPNDVEEKLRKLGDAEYGRGYEDRAKEGKARRARILAKIDEAKKAAKRGAA